eukprot:Sspe_Gene.52066::Locus_28861_Transcript_1_1_Confidence_1.000_Length_1240::g.52066::m.52066/K01824/EBP; cholestenol Delta-isomerase
MGRVSLLKAVTDPTFVFALSCLVTPAVIGCTSLHKLSALSPDHCPTLDEAFTPISCAFFGGLALFILICPGSSNLSPRDRRVANWYLYNGLIIKTLMDTISGSLQSYPLMTPQYNIVDPRYSRPLSDTTSLPVHLTSALEITVMAPLCLAVYWCYHKNNPLRYSLEIILCVLQIAGTYYFYASGLLTERRHIEQVMNPAVPFDFLFYFLFGLVICPFIWVVVPILCIRTATQDIVKWVKVKKTA